MVLLKIPTLCRTPLTKNRLDKNVGVKFSAFKYEFRCSEKVIDPYAKVLLYGVYFSAVYSISDIAWIVLTALAYIYCEYNLV